MVGDVRPSVSDYIQDEVFRGKVAKFRGVDAAGER
jgi:hypothetical protein